MRWAKILVDNPLLVKHLRSQLRPAQTASLVMCIVVLAALISWAGHVIQYIETSDAVMLLIGLQVLLLGLAGWSQINSSLGRARQSGILDFHRVTPLPPSVVALGFFLGAPIREYLLATATLPFAVFSSILAIPDKPGRGLIWLAQLECAVLAVCWLIQALGMLVCLAGKKRRSSVLGTIAAILGVLFVGGYGSAGFYLAATWLLEHPASLNFYGWMIPWLPWLVLYVAPALVFLGLAISRKIRAEGMHAFSKAQALACMAALTFLLLGGIWKIGRLIPPEYPAQLYPTDAIVLAAVYALAGAALVLTATITPSGGEYLRGVRRARHEGRRRPSPWSEAGSNRLVLFLICALVLVGATTAAGVVGREPLSDTAYWRQWGFDPTILQRVNLSDEAWLALRREMMSQPIAIAVLSVAYAGLALQYFSLRTQRSGMALTLIFLFVTWLVPLLAGSIIGMSSQTPQQDALTVLALSPVPGIALAAGFGELASMYSIPVAALAPAVTFAFVFKYLVILAQRKIDRQFGSSSKPEELDRAILRKSQDVPGARPV